MRRSIVALTLLLGLGACEQPTYVPMASPRQDAIGEQFRPPPPGYAAIYFFNPTAIGPALRVIVNGQELGVLGTQTWMRAEFAAGPHNIRCTGGQSSNMVQVVLKPGEMRYFDYEMSPGQTVCTVREVGPDLGRGAVMNSARAYQGR